jgi:hypothetical protein
VNGSVVGDPVVPNEVGDVVTSSWFGVAEGAETGRPVLEAVVGEAVVTASVGCPVGESVCICDDTLLGRVVGDPVATLSVGLLVATVGGLVSCEGDSVTPVKRGLFVSCSGGVLAGCAVGGAKGEAVDVPVGDPVCVSGLEGPTVRSGT